MLEEYLHNLLDECKRRIYVVSIRHGNAAMQTDKQVWDNVKSKADALWNKSRSPLAWEVFNLVGGAHDNACSCMAEGIAEDRWHEMAVGSLAQAAGSNECSDSARAWLRRVGFRF